MKIISLFGLVALLIGAVSSRLSNPSTDELIDFINSSQNLWRAGQTFSRNKRSIPESLPEVNGTSGNTTFNDTSSGYNFSKSVHLTELNGTNEDKTFNDTLTGYNTSLPLPEVNGTNGTYGNTTLNDTSSGYKNISLPSHFDARDKWKYCSSLLFDIRNQGSCESSWAMAAVSAMSDRLCISSSGLEIVHLSELDVMTCCMDCGSPCGGGLLHRAWKYAKKYGVVSGGDNGCKPYTIPGCQYGNNGAELPICIPEIPRLVCNRKCQAGFTKSYRSDRRKLRFIYKLTNEESIMSEIFVRGPVTTNIQVFQDFLQYRSGIYRYAAGQLIGLQSVKLLGWGEEENGVKYWLAANSWGTNWGDNGFFKILRGVNHLDVEKDAYAGVFRTK